MQFGFRHYRQSKFLWIKMFLLFCTFVVRLSVLTARRLFLYSARNGLFSFWIVIDKTIGRDLIWKCEGNHQIEQVEYKIAHRPFHEEEYAITSITNQRCFCWFAFERKVPGTFRKGALQRRRRLHLQRSTLWRYPSRRLEEGFIFGRLQGGGLERGFKGKRLEGEAGSEAPPSQAPFKGAWRVWGRRGGRTKVWRSKRASPSEGFNELH